MNNISHERFFPIFAGLQHSTAWPRRYLKNDQTNKKHPPDGPLSRLDFSMTERNGRRLLMGGGDSGVMA